MAALTPADLARLRAATSPWNTAVVTIFAAGAETTDSYGQPTTPWQPVAGLENVPCRRSSRGRERRDEAGIVTVYDERLVLNRQYPAITDGMRASLDGQQYTIERVMHDATGVFTALLLRRVS